MNLWDEILGRIETKVNRHSFYTWFKPTAFIAEDRVSVTVRVPNAIFKDWLTKHYSGVIGEAMGELQRPNVVVNFVSDTPSDSPPIQLSAEEVAALETGPAPTVPGPAGLNPRYAFDTFIVGTSNQFAHAACRAVAEAPSRSYNPLFIYGGVGLGKTHLMHAIGHYVLRHDRNLRLTYISAERFMNEMIFAIQRGQQLAFREKYRNVDLLLIDDIQFLAGKDGTQEEFFYTFGALQEAHKQIVMTSDKAPREIKGLEERLVSRFSQGMVTDIKPPDLETRVAILKQRSAAYGYELSNEVALLIASRVRANVRHLEGVLVRLTALTELGGTKITVGLAEEVLRDYGSSDAPALTLDRIAAVTADHFNVSVDLMRGKRRTNTIALPRQVAMYLARQRTALSLSDVGAWFKRDHTTVLHACGKIDQMRQSDARIGAALREILERLERP
jgi:chromosomal replication initiator protein